MRLMIFLRSCSYRLSILLCVCLLVTIGLQQSSVSAATLTPVPTIPEIHPTFGAIQTNTPNPTLDTLHTGVWSPTPDYSGCSSTPIPTGVALDDDWAAFCAPCMDQFEPTAIVKIPNYSFGTVAPFGTPDGTIHPTLTNAPTYPPLFFTATPPPTNTGVPTATNTPSITATPVLQEVYWDFRSLAHGTVASSELTWSLTPSGLSGYCGVSTATFPGSTRDGTGWHGESGYAFVPGLCGGNLASIIMPNYDSLAQTNPYDFALYVDDGESGYGVGDELHLEPVGGFDFGGPDDVHSCAYWGMSARCASGGSRLAWGVGGSSDDQIHDLRGLVISYISWGIHFPHIVGMSYSYYGDEFVEGSMTATPTTTSLPTLPPDVHNCHIPVFKDVSVPIAGIDIDTSVVETDCYRIIPEIDSSGWVVDVGFRIDGVDLCVAWHTFPTIQFFGITFGIDLILIIPMGFLIRRLLTF